MKINTLGSFGPVSRLTLGGGGIGQVWGPTSEDDAVATLRHAVDHGIDLIDAAPGYISMDAPLARALEIGVLVARCATIRSIARSVPAVLAVGVPCGLMGGLLPVLT